MMTLCGMVLLGIGVDRVRTAQSGFTIITAVYAILAGFALSIAGLIVP
jgi:hypothetical protein